MRQACIVRAIPKRFGHSVGVMTMHSYRTALTWSGRTKRITLRPHVVVRGGDPERVERLLHKAHQQCYIANSLRSEVALEPTIEVI